LLLQFKCTHLVPAEAPLPEEAIFNGNKVAAERRRAARKARHKEHEIAKRDQNNNRIKRWKVGERGISSNEDPSSEPSWSGDVASAAVDWSDMSGSSSSSPPRATKVPSSRRPQMAACDKNVGLSSRPVAHPAQEDQRTVLPRMPQAVDSDATPRRLQSLLIRGGGAPDVHVSLAAGRGLGSTPIIAEAGGSAPERSGERNAAVEVADRSGEAPELAGSKRAAPESGSSGRPAKKHKVHSKM
jgi:hypothetical protein